MHEAVPVMRKRRWWCGLGIGFFLLLCYFPLFLHLDSLSLRLWDESRRGVNAMEMAEGGPLLVPQFEGRPDMYGTKPPLLIWLQAAFMKVLGYNELAVRLPSALAGLLTVFLLAYFSHKHLHQPLGGCLAGLVLLTSRGYINYHGAISGDYDALLTLWLTAYSLMFFLFLESRQWRYFYWMALFIVLAGWTKGIAGLFFLPALALYALLKGRLFWLLRQPRLYISVFIVLFGIMSYYLAREQLNPGYVAAVLENEVGGRYFKAQEGQGRPFWFYFRVIHQYERFYPWQFFLPFAFIVGLWLKPLRKISGLALLIAVFFLLLISAARTKLEWYYLPVLPLLSLVVGLGLEQLYKSLAGRFSFLQQKALLAVFILALFGPPYYKTVKKVYAFEHEGWDKEKMVYRDMMRRLKEHKQYTILHPSYNGQIAFYKKKYKLRGYEISEHLLSAPPPEVQQVPAGPPDFQPAEKVLFCERAAEEALKKAHQFELLHHWRPCYFVEIKE